ncbi:hypothetical protein BDW22DRAFT_1427952 [Trametopsis cervina]|nr:hypothetical protein BDW22DRAFT_1427952 [Trametopsis cervina]
MRVKKSKSSERPTPTTMRPPYLATSLRPGSASLRGAILRNPPLQPTLATYAPTTMKARKSKSSERPTPTTVRPLGITRYLKKDGPKRRLPFNLSEYTEALLLPENKDYLDIHAEIFGWPDDLAARRECLKRHEAEMKSTLKEVGGKPRLGETKGIIYYAIPDADVRLRFWPDDGPIVRWNFDFVTVEGEEPRNTPPNFQVLYGSGRPFLSVEACHGLLPDDIFPGMETYRVHPLTELIFRRNGHEDMYIRVPSAPRPGITYVEPSTV